MNIVKSSLYSLITLGKIVLVASYERLDRVVVYHECQNMYRDARVYNMLL